jgi:hypothetical protein
MERRYRRGFSTSEKTEMWDRWQRGESMRSIGRVFGKPSSSIYFQLAPYGGIRPAVRRDQARRTAALAVGIDVVGARGDIARDCGSAVDPLYGIAPWPVAIDGEP